MHLRKLAIGALSILLLAGGCSRGLDDGVLVFAAASLTDALEAQAERYLEALGLPGDTIRFHFHSSSVCAAQIRQGAPADLFVSADERIVRELAAEGLVDGSTFLPLLRNRLVLIIPAGHPSPIRSFADLEGIGWHRFAMGNPESTPVGRYGKQALESMGLWEQVEARLIRAEHVRQALLYVATGEAEAGLVYASDAVVEEGVVVAADVPPEHTPDILYAGAVVREARQAGAARRFLEWLASDSAAETWQDHGFLAVDPPVDRVGLPAG